jgi:hypothetical protein
MALRGELDLASYDRLFPSQDFLPASGSIGTLIALPLQGECRKRGTTVFIELATLEPVEDQWAYLSTLDRLTPRRAENLATAMRPLRVGPSAQQLWRASSNRTKPPMPAQIQVRLGAGVAVERAGLPPVRPSTPPTSSPPMAWAHSDVLQARQTR